MTILSKLLQPYSSAPSPRAKLHTALEQLAFVAACLHPFALILGTAAAEMTAGLVALCFLIALVSGGLKPSPLTSHWRPVMVLMLLAWAWLFITTALSPVPQEADLGIALAWGRLIPLIAALWLWLGSNPFYRYWISLTCLLAVSFVILDLFFQYMFGTSLFGVEPHNKARMKASFNEPVVGFYLTHMAPLALLVFCSPGFMKGRQRAYLLAALLVLLAAVFLSGERLFFAYTFLGCVLVAVSVFRWKAAFVLLVGLLLIAGLLAANPKFAHRYTTHTAKEFATMAQDLLEPTFRLESKGSYANNMKRGWQALNDRPLLGFGMMGFQGYCQHYLKLDEDLVDRKYGCTSHPHHTWLNWGATAGYPGIVIGLILMAVLAIQIWRSAPGTAAGAEAYLSLRRALLLWALIPITSPLFISESFFVNFTELNFWFALGVVAMWQNLPSSPGAQTLR